MRGGRQRSWTGWAMVLVLVLLLAGCATIGGDTGEIPQNALDPAAGSIAEEQDALWNLVFPIAVGVFVLVQGLILFAVWRFRSRGDESQLPKQVAGNTRLEIFWTIIPALILALIAIPTVRTIFSIATIEEDAMNVRVIAKQYWWEFQYEDPDQQGVVTATQLHIPTGREVRLRMQSVAATQSYNPADVPDGETLTGGAALGVIHSFWVPRLAGKLDVVPGHTREMKIRTDEPGLYPGQCAEFCGLAHANMKFSVLAQSPEEFDAWIAEQAEPAAAVEEGLAAEGQRVFTSAQCVACHAIDGYPAGGEPGAEPTALDQQPRVGPNLTHFNTRDTFAGGILDVDSDEELAAWLRNPQAEKPGAQMPNLGLSDEEIDALVAYLRTLD
jgi:cytochrome c oxidase subunit II